jgi:hypothetical protein
MTSTTTRRALLTAAAAVPAIAVLPAPSSAIATFVPAAVDPVIELAERTSKHGKITALRSRRSSRSI